MRFSGIAANRRAFGAGLLAAMLGARSATARSQAAPAQNWSQLWPPNEVIRLWPGEAPGWVGGMRPAGVPDGWSGGAWPAHFLRRTIVPTLNVFRPEQPSGEALLVCPGGAYVFVSAENEGLDVAHAFNAMGVTVFVLSYRLPGEGWRDRADVPLQDAQRAVRLIRHGADAFGIRPERLGVLGFSAGGHLAATLATDHAQRVYEPVDAADHGSACPAYAGLIYPVILTDGADAHPRSRDELLGPGATPEAAVRRSPERHVGPDTPRCFLAHARDDESVPVANSERMYAALNAAGIPCEAHFFAAGGHAFGTGRPGQPNTSWPQMFARWATASA